MVDQGKKELLEDLDADLWVIAKGYRGRLYLGWNPHLRVPGRIGAWSTDYGFGTRISKSDVLDSSPESKIWIDAYLTGSEPSFEYMFGDVTEDADDYEAKRERWQAQCRHYRKSGDWSGGDWFELDPFEEDATLPEFVFTRRADEIWIWANRAWKIAPDPSIFDGEMVIGSICQQRMDHQFYRADSMHMVCEDCGNSIAVKP